MDFFCPPLSRETDSADRCYLFFIIPSSFILILPATLAALTTVSCSYLYLRRRRSHTMLISIIFGVLATLLLSASPVLAVDRAAAADLRTRLQTAITHADFWNALSDDDMVFDFGKQSPTPFKPGSVLNANVATWPLLMSGDQAIAQLNFGPCAMLAPHLHPHATNIVVTVKGELRTIMHAENGAMVRHTVLTPGKSTIFPKASMHAMVNEGCTNAQAYSFLSSRDPGTLNLAQSFWTVGPDIGMQVMPFIRLASGVGGHGGDGGNGHSGSGGRSSAQGDWSSGVGDGDWNATGKKIPPVGTGSQEGYEACRRRCGLD